MRPLIPVLLVLGCGALAACSSTDPRCVALCEYEGDRDTCSPDSMSSCLSVCEARIAGVAGLCATCLLEDARFEPGPRGITLCTSDAACASGVGCTGELCSFCMGDAAEEARCNPPREVACEPSFRSATECTSACPAE